VGIPASVLHTKNTGSIWNAPALGNVKDIHNFIDRLIVTERLTGHILVGYLENLHIYNGTGFSGLLRLLTVTSN
jgi:hypothetical protein